MTSASTKAPSTPALVIQRAVRKLRAGQPVRLEGAQTSLVAFAAETAAESQAAVVTELAGSMTLVLTNQRVAALTGRTLAAEAVHVPLPTRRAAGVIQALADPAADADADALARLNQGTPASTLAVAAIELAKLGGLLPAVLCLEGNAAGAFTDAAVSVPIEAVRAYRRLEGVSLQPVSEASVPLHDSEDTRVVAFRPVDGGAEQFAIVIGDPAASRAPLVRLHSECFTGDLLGSLRCDCGDQLRGAIRRMAREGAGVLLYLAQEGRGIGLANKLRAYALQDEGLDTVEANTHLGFEPDERDFWAAATMLRHLGVERIRLLTNNPAKITQLRAYGIEVVSRLPHVFEPNEHNRDYLATKALKSGHLIDLEEAEAGPLNGRGYGTA